MDFDLNGYKPEKVKSGFEPFKGIFRCQVNSARIEDYSGDAQEIQGHSFLKYELEICDGEERAGRRLWKSIDLNDERLGKSGKTRLQELADLFNTLGLSFYNKLGLQACLENFCGMTLVVKCWYYTDKQNEVRQMHKIEGLSENKISDIPF